MLKHHFLPNKELKKRAKLLSHSFLLSYSLFVIPLVLIFKTLPKAAPGVLGYSSQISTQDLIYYTNQRRQKDNLGLLKENTKLTQAAEKKVKDMFAKNYWAHVAPDGVEPWNFIINEDYDYIYAGENLAKNFTSSKEIVEAWYKSPSHRENLLNPKFQDVGFAIQNGVLDGYETTLVVQMFGRLRTAANYDSKPQSQPLGSDAEQINALEKNTAEKAKILEQPPIQYPAVKGLKPSLDLFKTSKTSYILFILYVIALLLFDLTYSRKHQLSKNTGHTVAHILFLSFAALALWVIFAPGRIT